MLQTEHHCAFDQSYLPLPVHSKPFPALHFLRAHTEILPALLLHPSALSPPFILWVQVWLLTMANSCHAENWSLSVPPPPSPRQRKCRFVGCQEAMLIQMTGNPNSKASSNPDFSFSPFPLHAHTHLVWAATGGLAKLISSLKVSLEPLPPLGNKETSKHSETSELVI